jgi:integrase
MASISNDDNGTRRILFNNKERKRRTLWLGKVSKRTAQTIKLRVELLLAAQLSGSPIDAETASWIGEIGDELAEKLAKAGLIAPRSSATLKTFLDDYIASRTDARPRTILNLNAAAKRLVIYFGKDRDLREVSEEDAEAFAIDLRSTYALATCGRTIKRCRQFFKIAAKRGLVPSNPFTEVKAPACENDARKHFIPASDAMRLIDVCPDAEWRLLVALARFGGLRTPSESLALTRNDIDWQRNRIRVNSPKMGVREVPLFPELLPYLLDVCEREDVDAEAPLITHHRGENLGTQLVRFIKRAVLTRWPRVWPTYVRADDGVIPALPAPRRLFLAREHTHDCGPTLPASDR